jgi:hypothetical protein
MTRKFNIDDLNEQLFNQLQTLNTDLKGDDLKNEIAKAKSMADIASVILEGKRIQLEAIELVMKGDVYVDQLDTIINPQKQLH